MASLENVVAFLEARPDICPTCLGREEIVSTAKLLMRYFSDAAYCLLINSKYVVWFLNVASFFNQQVRAVRRQCEALLPKGPIMTVHCLIPSESGLTGIDHDLAVALARHREEAAHGKVFTFPVGDSREVGDTLLSTTHRDTALELAAIPDETRRLIHQKLVARVFRDGSTSAIVAIEPPTEERPKPSTFQVVRETGPMRDIFHFNPVK